MKYAKYILFLFICLSTSCEDKKKLEIDNHTDDYKIHLESNHSEYEIVEGPTPMSNVISVEFYGNKYLIYDNSRRFHLFDNDYNFIKLIEHHGEGPCEYMSVMDYMIKDDIIYILDRDQSKIIGIDIIENECIIEFQNEIFINLNSIYKLNNKIYLTRGFLHSHMDKEVAFLYNVDMDSDYKLDSLNVTIEDLHAVLFPAPGRIKSKIKSRSGKLFFFYPHSEKIFSYDFNHGTIDSIYIPMDQPEVVNQNIDNITDVIDLVSRTETIVNLFLFENYFSVLTILGQQPETIWRIKFFDYDGHFIGTIYSNNRVIEVKKNEFQTLMVEPDPEGSNPYRIHKHTYSIEENI